MGGVCLLLNPPSLPFRSDGAASAATYARNFALGPALRSWARSMLDNQDVCAAVPGGKARDGIVAFIVPDDGMPPAKTDASWSWAMAEAPTQVASVYGDTDFLSGAYQGLTRLLAFYEKETNATSGIMDSQALFGDWCANFNRSLYVANTARICATSTHLSMLTTASVWAAALGDSNAASSFASKRASLAKPFRAAYAIKDEAAGTWVDALEQAPPLVALNLGSDVAGPKTAAWLVNDVETTQAMHQVCARGAQRGCACSLLALLTPTAS